MVSGSASVAVSAASSFGFGVRQRHHAGFVDVGDGHRDAGRFGGRAVVGLHGDVVDVVRVRIGGVLEVRRRSTKRRRAAGDRELRGIVAGQRPSDVVIDRCKRRF